MTALTPTQESIRADIVEHRGARWSPLWGRRITSAHCMEKKGYGRVVTSQASRRPKVCGEHGWTDSPYDYWFIWEV